MNYYIVYWTKDVIIWIKGKCQKSTVTLNYNNK